MSIQFIKSCYAMGVTQEQQYAKLQGYYALAQRYNEIEERDYYLLQQSQGGTQQTTQFSGFSDQAYTIAVVDFCDDSDADIDLDGDGKGDMAHGNVVAHLIESGYKNSDIYTFDISAPTPSETNERMLASLQYIVDEIKNGTCKYDAINLSLSSRITYSDLSKYLGVNITKDNVSKYQSQIREWLLTDGAKNGYSTTAQVVQLLEQIEALGADVFIAAANIKPDQTSDNQLNLYSIAKNTTTVGALSKNGGKASFSFDNALIDTWALGEIEVKKLYDASGNFAGYDLNNDGVKDIDKKYNSGGTNCSNPFIIGTSFASPYMLMQTLSA